MARLGWRCLALGVGLMSAVVGGVVTASGIANAGEPSGFAVSPAFGQVTVLAKQPKVTYGLKITNRNAADQSFRLNAVDFGSLGEEGGVAFLGQPTSELEHEYGLASWMVLERDSVVVRGGQSVNVAVTIDNRASLAPGGHYGAVLATAVTEAGRPVQDGVGVKQVLSSLILVTKEGGGTVDLRLAGQTLGAGLWNLPKTVEHRFQNAGNVHAMPRGVVMVQDPRGKVVVRGALNEGSGVVLPESFRRYKTELVRTGLAWMPGQYRVVTTYRHEGTEEMKTQVEAFWFVGAGIVWAVAAGVLVMVGAMVWWLWIRPRRRRKRA